MNAKDYTAADLARWADAAPKLELVQPDERNTIDAEVERLLYDAGIVANALKERQIAVKSETLLRLLKYSRQPDGAPVIPGHALNGATMYFIKLMQGKGFRLSQYYQGERDTLFGWGGSQRLLVSW